MIYTHVLSRCAFAMRIPVDQLDLHSGGAANFILPSLGKAELFRNHSGGAANFILPRLRKEELFRKQSGQAAGIFEGSGIGPFPAKRLIFRAKDYRLR